MGMGIVIARQKAAILRTALLALVAFAAGWYGPGWTRGKSVASKTTVVSTLVVKKYPKPSADILKQAEADFAKALHAQGTALDRWHALDAFFAKIDAGTVKAMMDDILAKPLSNENHSMLATLASRLGEMDPGTAIVWLQGVQDKKLNNELADYVFDAYSAKDPDGALNTLARMSTSHDLGSADAATILNFARQDPRAALQALQALPNDAPNKALLQNYTFSVFEQWALQDPASAAQEAFALPEGQSRSHSLDNVAQSWAKVDPAATVVWLGTQPADSEGKEIQSIIENLGITDGPALLPFLNSLPDGPNNPLFIQQLNADAANPKPYVLQGVTSAWAQSDPVGLLAFAVQNLAGKAYDTAYTAAINQLTNTDPASAAAYLAQNPDPTVAAQTYPSLAKMWAQQDPAAALAWAQSLSTDNPTLRSSALNNVAQGMVATDPEAAAAYVQQNMANDPDFVAMATHIANAWGSVGGDPEAALNWAESLPPVTQNRAVVAAVTQLAKADPAIAAQTAQAELDSLTKLTATLQTNLQQIVNGTANQKNAPSTSQGR